MNSSITTYSAVDTTGNIVLSRFTADSSVTLKPGFRLLPDRAELMQYDPYDEYITRVEPVLPEHTEIIYVVTPYPLELQVAKARERRNQQLAESDRYMLVDLWESYSADMKQQWKDYRQALRDVPEQAGFPYTIEWPMQPSEFQIISL